MTLNTMIFSLCYKSTMMLNESLIQMRQKFTSGDVFTLGDNAITTRSTKQIIITRLYIHNIPNNYCCGVYTKYLGSYNLLYQLHSVLSCQFRICSYSLLHQLLYITSYMKPKIFFFHSIYLAF